eukprot:6178551-Pleurochrysis_carterae.AAC.1
MNILTERKDGEVCLRSLRSQDPHPLRDHATCALDAHELGERACSAATVSASLLWVWDVDGLCGFWRARSCSARVCSAAAARARGVPGDR